MVENICRLCFEKKTGMIDLFTAKGVKLNAASVIRMHFPDEVREDDLLPKSICVSCWDTLADFHRFYKAVDEAKASYLKNTVTREVPTFAEINCDGYKCDDSNLSVKVEPSDVVVVKLEVEPIEDGGVKDSRAQDQYECDSPGSDRNDNHENDMNFDKGWALSAPVATSTELTAKSTAVGGDLESLVRNYMDMECETCKHPFESLAAANGHYRREHSQRSIIVKCCQKRVDLYDMLEHIQYHLNPNIFKCDKCDRKFMLRRMLRNHLRSHWPKTFECDVCKKKFATRNIIKTHILVVHGGEKEKRKCDICNKIFVTKYSLNSHVKLVHQRRYQKVCHICAKVYSTSTSFRHHMKEHSDVKDPRVVCQICGRTYKTPKGLRNHMAAHNEENECFKCPQCPKISPNRHALSTHIRVMHNYKLHECHLCERKCKSAVALMEHVATHTGEYLYDCNYCSKQFKSHSNMYQHFRDSHPVEWSADRKTKPRENHR